MRWTFYISSYFPIFTTPLMFDVSYLFFNKRKNSAFYIIVFSKGIHDLKVSLPLFSISLTVARRHSPNNYKSINLWFYVHWK